MYAFLELVFYAGVLKSNMLKVKDVCDLDGSGIEMFCRTMLIRRLFFY